MNPVKPSETRSQFRKGNDTISGIHVVTNVYQDEDGLIPSLITCWELSIWERIKLLFSGRIYVEQLTATLVPQKLTISREEVNLDKIEEMETSTWEGATFS